jgi:hypothetical protein
MNSVVCRSCPWVVFVESVAKIANSLSIDFKSYNFTNVLKHE